jgi:hypothetical protein
MKNNNIPDAKTNPEDHQAFIAWGDDVESRNKAVSESSKALEEYTGLNRAFGYAGRYGNDYSNLDSHTSGRPGLTKREYDYFRRAEAIPTKIKDIMAHAENIYQRVGLVKNVIDLMGDFASQGIRLVHRNKRIERFYRQWFKKINGRDRSERFLNNLYKSGNVVVNRQTAKISLKVTKKLYTALAAPDVDVKTIDSNTVEKKEIPWIYTFIDPVCVSVSGGSLASFVQNKSYELALPTSLRKLIASPKTPAEVEIINNLPESIIEAAKSKKPYPLDGEKIAVYHYKKDDWQSWAYPMIYSIMDDITIIEKLKLADIAALDGAISNIRIFKLGSLEHKIAPTKAATAKLAQILGNNVGGGTMDLVWGPDIELLESKTSVHQFLGESKYIPHLNSIYAGLGIPPTLTGTFGAAGTTNNFISLKTLTQRLQYGRDVLIDFWEKEIIAVQKAMGFRYPAKVEFDRMDLSNEDTEKALLIQLSDRNIISDELIQTRFGFDPDIEKTRLNREHRDRQTTRMVNKAGPWHDPQPEYSLRKIALQGGMVTPSQVGLELSKKKSGEKTMFEIKQEMSKVPINNSSPNLSGIPNQGRPKNSKDSEKRAEKKFSPRTGANTILWATMAQEQINDIINPIMLNFYTKKNMRSLSNEQTDELDVLKTKVLFSLEPLSKIDDKIINAKLNEVNTKNISNVMADYSVFINNIMTEAKRSLSVEEIKQAKSLFYSSLYS